MRIKTVRIMRDDQGKQVRAKDGRLVAMLKKKAAGRATGPGSIDCEKQIERLMLAGQFQEAYDLSKANMAVLSPKMRERVKWYPVYVETLARQRGANVS